MTTPDDLIRIASDIRDNHTDDVGLRSTVNRAYYAAYHAADELANKLLLPEPINKSTGSHQQLFNRLIECDSTRTKDWLTVKSIGYTATKILKPFRKHADYQLGDPLPSNSADETLEKATIIVEKQKSILITKFAGS